jgi:uncharacterized OB-fold protein
MDEKDYLVIDSGEAEQPFRYALGRHASKFFQELRDNQRLLATRCPSCGKVYVPPRGVCGACFVAMDDFVEVGPEGTIGTFTILRYAFIDPETGQKKPVPYGYGFIKLDGANTLFQHYIDIQEGEVIKIGARIRPVFAAQRRGTLKDIVHFQVVDV